MDEMDEMESVDTKLKEALNELREIDEGKFTERVMSRLHEEGLGEKKHKQQPLSVGFRWAFGGFAAVAVVLIVAVASINLSERSSFVAVRVTPTPAMTFTPAPSPSRALTILARAASLDFGPAVPAPNRTRDIVYSTEGRMLELLEETKAAASDPLLRPLGIWEQPQDM